jgi:hypothetical protein
MIAVFPERLLISSSNGAMCKKRRTGEALGFGRCAKFFEKMRIFSALSDVLTMDLKEPWTESGQ